MSEAVLSGARVLVVAFEGWNDAGEAASGAVRRLRDELGLTPRVELDAEAYFDYQFTRPVIMTEPDGTRHIVWPSVTLFAPPPGGAQVHLLLGAEPSRGWQSFAAEVLDVVAEYEFDIVVFLGAMLADVPHSRPIGVHASSEAAEVREILGLSRSQYEGPVGILSVLAAAFEEAGVPTVSIWASVPHYVHNAPSPKATLALLDRLEELVGLSVPRDELLAEAAAWESGIDQLADEDEDMASYIASLERARDTVDSPEASGEAIAEEFERYLRGRGDQSGS